MNTGDLDLVPVNEAAQRLGISRVTLRRRLAEWARRVTARRSISGSGSFGMRTSTGCLGRSSNSGRVFDGDRPVSSDPSGAGLALSETSARGALDMAPRTLSGGGGREPLWSRRAGAD